VNLLIFLIVLSVLIIIHEFGHFVMAKKSGVKIERFSLGFGRKIFGFRSAETEYTVRLIPMGGYVKLAGDNEEEFTGAPYEFLSKSVFTRAKVIFMGPFLNYILALFVFWAIFLMGYPTLTSKVGGLLEGFPAASAGIQKGDTIVAIDGVPVTNWEQMQRLIRNRGLDYVTLSIQRGERIIDKKVTLRKESLKDLVGREHQVKLIGILPSEEIIYVRHGVFQSFNLAVQRLFTLTALTYQALWRIITGALSVRDSITGPLGIFYITSRAASTGIIALLHVVAVLSMSLAIFNLLPLPILDGGHIALLFVEKLKGSRISARANRIINDIGLSIIIAIAILVFINDIIKFQILEKIAEFFNK